VKYRTIVADPPWPQPDSGARTQSTKGNWRGKWLGYISEIPYSTMTLAEIRALPVADLAAPDCHLYMWTTNRFLRESFSVLDAWGFKFSTVLVWCKAPMGIGLGGAFTLTNEFVLYARRGSLPPLQRQDSTWWQFKRPYNENGGPAHSKKPEGFLDVVEQVSPAPRLEMFARRNRLGWDTWGDEALNHVEISA
jgi:N6-adenosine-specific RNA methylase IME4